MQKGKSCNRWTEQELEILFEYYETKGPQFVSELLSTMGYNRTRSGCGQTGRILGLKYKGPKMCFQPGQVPPNKGKKMQRDIYMQCAPTMFKKGHQPANHMSVGSEVFRADNYWWTKVAEPNCWQLKHRILWEKHFGPIAPGMLIIFKDGNPHNFNLDNLEQITKKENCYRNRWGSGPSEYSMITGRAASIRLNKKGLTDKAIRQNPQLLELAKAETILKLKMRKKRHDTSR